MLFPPPSAENLSESLFQLFLKTSSQNHPNKTLKSKWDKICKQTEPNFISKEEFWFVECGKQFVKSEEFLYPQISSILTKEFGDEDNYPKNMISHIYQYVINSKLLVDSGSKTRFKWFNQDATLNLIMCGILVHPFLWKKMIKEIYYEFYGIENEPEEKFMNEMVSNVKKYIFFEQFQLPQPIPENTITIKCLLNLKFSLNSALSKSNLWKKIYLLMLHKSDKVITNLIIQSFHKILQKKPDEKTIQFFKKSTMDNLFFYCDKNSVYLQITNLIKKCCISPFDFYRKRQYKAALQTVFLKKDDSEFNTSFREEMLKRTSVWIRKGDSGGDPFVNIKTMLRLSEENTKFFLNSAFLRFLGRLPTIEDYNNFLKIEQNKIKSYVHSQWERSIALISSDVFKKLKSNQKKKDKNKSSSSSFKKLPPPPPKKLLKKKDNNENFQFLEENQQIPQEINEIHFMSMQESPKKFDQKKQQEMFSLNGNFQNENDENEKENENENEQKNLNENENKEVLYPLEINNNNNESNINIDNNNNNNIENNNIENNTQIQFPKEGEEEIQKINGHNKEQLFPINIENSNYQPLITEEDEIIPQQQNIDLVSLQEINFEDK